MFFSDLVHVLDPGDEVGGDVSGILGVPLPPDGGQGHVGGEQEKQTDKGENRDDDGGEVQASAAGGSVGGGAVGRLGGSVGLRGRLVGHLGGAVGLDGGSVAVVGAGGGQGGEGGGGYDETQHVD